MPKVTTRPSHVITRTSLSPTRRTPAPARFVAKADDPLDALAAQLGGFAKPVYAPVNAHGKPLGGVEVFGARRAPARRAAFRQPPR